ncbi:DUF3887 domain-containing protein [Oculatella sp. LEGE 06141]|uniref:DUF3887 domain-containing protein n=1 Tax=Oculatella sp. LEGE 06141 TaxID=1828648 RepID=UPI00187FB443|nr:DUF3887 domain-containing protein [Oculatella sp. LEGE 06141]MBE9182187.1 DUF3887 domain-containing protein [Oculatella sp. LEGE 06141]
MRKTISVLLITATLTGVSLPVLAQQTETAPAELPAAQADRLTATAQEFVALLADGDYQGALQKYAPSSRASITAATLQQGWEDAVTANGDFQRLVQVETEALDSEGGDSVAIATVEFANGAQDFLVVFTANSEIVSIQAVTD